MDELDDLVEVYVELDYMAQNFHKMVNFKMKTNTENRIVKKIYRVREKGHYNEDMCIENVLHNIVMRKLLNCWCQCDS